MKFETQVLIGIPCLIVTKSDVLTGNKMAVATILYNHQNAVTQLFMNRF